MKLLIFISGLTAEKKAPYREIPIELEVISRKGAEVVTKEIIQNGFADLGEDDEFIYYPPHRIREIRCVKN